MTGYTTKGLVWLLGVGLAACGTSAPLYTSDGQCLSMADALKTLRTGDELPRVVEVMGPPTETYRVRGSSFLGKSYDVLVYDLAGTACSKTLLDSPKALHLLFDDQGRLMAQGNKRFRTLQKATSIRGGRLGE